MIDSGEHDGRAEDGGGGASGPTTSNLDLKPLAPEPTQDHRFYAELLTGALKLDDSGNSQIRNIALTGRFGAGKSSVIQHYRNSQTAKERRRTAMLSLSTMSPEPVSGARSTGGGIDSDTASLAQNNRIQKELVKQLLYREPAGRLRQSRYHRIKAHGWRTAALVGLGVALAVWLTLFLLDQIPDLRGAAQPGASAWLRLTVYGTALAMVAAAAGAAFYLGWERFIISKVSAGGANFELSPRTHSYFDQHLDEISYFFEHTKTDLVIFEDIDRFGDYRIFQDLRDLNVLLNNAVERRRTLRRIGNGPPPIRFVYATRDSIFQGLGVSPQDQERGALAAENERANRTKFFDLIIPLVPFITQESARGLLRDELHRVRDVQVSPKLVSLVGRQITDMRLLRNITNEFAVFQRRLIGEQRGAPELTPDRLFALIVFKNIHPSEFEDAVKGAGKLRDLYSHAANCRNQHLTELRSEQQQRRRSGHFPDVTRQRARDYSQRLGTLLWGRNPDNWAPADTAWRAVSAPVGAQDPESVEFWQWVATQSAISLKPLNRSGGQKGAPFNVNRAHFERWLTTDLSEDFPEDPDPEAAATELRALGERIEHVRLQDFHQLEGAAPPPGATDDAPALTVGEWLNENLVDMRLLQELVREGYVGRDFASYTGEADRTLPVAVQTFIARHIDTNEPDPQFSFVAAGNAQTLSTDEVQAERSHALNVLLRDRTDFLEMRAGYSIELLDHLLGSRQTDLATRIVSRLLARPEEMEHDFVRLYLTQGEQSASFAQLLAPRDAGVFTVLAEVFADGVRTGERSDEVWSGALRAARPQEIRYDFDDAAFAVLDQRQTALSAIASAALPPVEANAVVELLGQADVMVSNIAALSSGGALRSAVVHSGRFDITTSNLVEAAKVSSSEEAGSEGPVDDDLRLDRLQALTPVWERCQDDISAYLQALPDGQNAIEGPEALVEALRAQLLSPTWTQEQLEGLLERAASSAALATLDSDKVDPTQWPTLASAGLIAPTPSNLVTYAAENAYGFDEPLARLLRDSEGVFGAEDAEQEVVDQVVSLLLDNAKGVLSGDERADLVNSLHVDSCTLTDTRAADGDLLWPMTSRGLFPDEPATYQRFILSAGWEAARPTSDEQVTRFSEVMTPAVLGAQVTPFLKDPQAPTRLISAVLASLQIYAAPLPVAERSALLQIAAEASVVRKLALEGASMVQFAAAGGREAADRVLALIAQSTPETASDDEVREALGSIGEPWSHFSTRAETAFGLPKGTTARAAVNVLEARQMARVRPRKTMSDRVEIR